MPKTKEMAMIGDFSIETLRSLPAWYAVAIAVALSGMITAAIAVAYFRAKRRTAAARGARQAAGRLSPRISAQSASAPAVNAAAVPARVGSDDLARTVVSLSAALDRLDRAIVGCIELTSRLSAAEDDCPRRATAVFPHRAGAGAAKPAGMLGCPEPDGSLSPPRLALTEEQLRLYRHAGRLKERSREPEKVLQPAR
jgi:hypothetical protein